MGSVTVVAALAVAGFTAIVHAQRAATAIAPLEWLPAASARPQMFTLVVVDDRTGLPVDRPLVCPTDPPGWVLGGEDGRVVYGGNPPDTLHWRVLGPLHEAREIAVPWAVARGRIARLALPRRAGGEINPSCDD